MKSAKRLAAGQERPRKSWAPYVRVSAVPTGRYWLAPWVLSAAFSDIVCFFSAAFSVESK
jgi:hypothetical protein